jgi:hypothetical protein
MDRKRLQIESEHEDQGSDFPLVGCHRADSMEIGGHMSGEDEKPKKQGMKVYTPDKSELMVISKIERNGHNLLIHGKIMGSLPMKAVIRPDEARKGIGLIGLKTFLFLLTFLFGRKRQTSWSIDHNKNDGA